MGWMPRSTTRGRSIPDRRSRTTAGRRGSIAGSRPRSMAAAVPPAGRKKRVHIPGIPPQSARRPSICARRMRHLRATTDAYAGGRPEDIKLTLPRPAPVHPFNCTALAAVDVLGRLAWVATRRGTAGRGSMICKLRDFEDWYVGKN
jgi:hypothetical protein